MLRHRNMGERYWGAGVGTGHHNTVSATHQGLTRVPIGAMAHISKPPWGPVEIGAGVFLSFWGGRGLAR